MYRLSNVADLHVHTVASDGACTLAEVAAIAREKDLETIAVTDHDSVGAFDGAPAGLPVEVIPGVELSAAHEEREAHVLGYFIDVTNAALRARLGELQNRRLARLDIILAKLREHDIHIDPAVILDVAAGSVGRLHVAERLVADGHAANVYMAFRDYLGPAGKAYVPKMRLSVRDAVALIHEAGGAAVLAHPGNFFTDDEARSFAAVGLDGLEAHYPSHAPADTARWLALAETLGLVVTGGSDFHGRSVSETDLGAAKVTREHVNLLRERSARYGVRLP